MSSGQVLSWQPASPESLLFLFLLVQSCCPSRGSPDPSRPQCSPLFTLFLLGGVCMFLSSVDPFLYWKNVNCLLRAVEGSGPPDQPSGTGGPGKSLPLCIIVFASCDPLKDAHSCLPQLLCVHVGVPSTRAPLFFIDKEVHQVGPLSFQKSYQAKAKQSQVILGGVLPGIWCFLPPFPCHSWKNASMLNL